MPFSAPIRIGIEPQRRRPRRRRRRPGRPDRPGSAPADRGHRPGPGYRDSPPRATLYAASSCPRRRSASPSSRNARLAGSSASRAVSARMSSVTVALQLLHHGLHRLPQPLHRRRLRLLARRAGAEPAPRGPGLERLGEAAQRRLAQAEQPPRLGHERIGSQHLLAARRRRARTRPCASASRAGTSSAARSRPGSASSPGCAGSSSTRRRRW